VLNVEILSDDLTSSLDAEVESDSTGAMNSGDSRCKLHFFMAFMSWN
jgi:hypothetical protein